MTKHGSRCRRQPRRGHDRELTHEPWHAPPVAVLVSPVLVGRRAELDAVMAAFDRARTGDPATVLVGGEAGVGKTRLVEEAADRAAGAGARVLIGGCGQLGGEGLPLAPLVDAFRTLAPSTPPEGLDQLLRPPPRGLARPLPPPGPPGR